MIVPTIIITGDINIRLDRPDDPLACKFRDVIEPFGLVNQVTVPTHDGGGLLDVLITRSEQAAGSVEIVDVGLSDHRLLKWSMDMRRPEPIYETVTRRRWKNFCPDDFRTELLASRLCDQNSFDRMDIDELTECYNTDITTILDRMLPVKTVSSRVRPSDPWFDDDCRRAKRQVRHLETRFRRTGIDTVGRAWSTQQRRLHRLCNRKRRAFWVEKIQSDKSQPRKLWQSVNTLLGRQKVAADSQIAADDFQDFFTQKVADVRSSTEGAGPTDYTSPPGCNMSTFQHLSTDDVIRLIQATPDKQSPVDPLPTSLLKSCAEELAPFLTRLINISLSAGIVPSKFKAAVITPLLKKPTLDGADVRSYRPISNLPVITKLLERAVCSQLVII